METSEREPAERAPLSADRIVEVAIGLADADGFDGLSMRRLAKALGYEVMSLYNHVAGKDDLVDAMVEAVAAEMPLPRPGPAWRAALREAYIGGLRVLQAHPWAVPLWSSRLPGPRRLDHMEAVLATLAAADLTPEAADHGFHALNTHLQGFALQEQAFTLPSDGDEGVEAALSSFRDGLDVDRHPSVHAHVVWHETAPPAQEYEFVLDLILDGIG